MNKILNNKQQGLAVSLIGAMLLTRFHHFGSALSLPDASLAVFFFAGFYPRKILLPLLMLEAVLIDYIAIANGTSGWCVSPAYVFLIPTYAVMWGAGRLTQALHYSTTKNAVISAVFMVSATTLAFLISNGSFYFFSGKFDAMLIAEYTSKVMHYFPAYISSTLLYTLAGFAIKTLFNKLSKENIDVMAIK